MIVEIEIKNIKASDAGPLSSTLEKFERKIELCEKEGYTKEVARLVKLMVEFGLLDVADWMADIKENPEQAKNIESMLFFSKILFIRLNNIAQKGLNNMSMPSIVNQLNASEDLQKYFPNIKFV